MYRYKLKDQKTTGDVIIPNVGVVKDGYIESPVELENPNLELVREQEQTEQPAATHVAGVVPQNTQPQAPAAAIQVQQPLPPAAPAAESNGAI